jgi:hypothetical protein
LHQKRLEKVQNAEHCTKGGKKKCKQPNFAPKAARKSANNRTLHQKR